MTVVAIGPLPKAAPQEHAPMLPRDPRCLPVLKRIARKYKITVSELRSPSRARWLVPIRHEAVWEMRRLDPPVSRNDCAQAAGFDNHTSAINAERKHQARLDAAARKLSPEPQNPAGTGGVPASPAHTLPVPAGLRREPGQVSAESGEGSPGGGAKTAR